MKVAAIQFCPVPRDREGNLKRLSALALKAARQQAELIVMPELALSGYSMMNTDEANSMSEGISAFRKGMPSEGSALSSMNVFYEIALKYDTNLAWGIVEKDLATGNLYNTQVLMCKDGSYEIHRKINFFSSDFLWASEGRANPPIRQIVDKSGKTVKVGLLVCRDIRDKKDDSWNDFYEPGDADVVCLSANWGRGGFPATAWMDFVKDNSSALIVSNRYGIETPNDFGEGGSCIISKGGSVQCEGLLWSQDCIVYGEV